MKAIKWSLIFVVVLFFISCTTIGKEEIDNLRDGDIMVIGHAGLGFPSILLPFNPYPANGFTALKKAMDYGADGLEIDIHMTKDSVLVLYHDLSLESSTEREGCIRDLTWDELRGTPYDLGFYFDLFHDDEIIRLDSLLKWTETLSAPPHLQFDVRTINKCSAEAPNKDFEILGGKLVEILNLYNYPKEKVRLISTFRPFVKYLNELESGYPLSYEITDGLEQGLVWTEQMGITSVTVKPKLLTTKIVEMLHLKGLEVITFGAKSYSGNVKLVRLNPDVIQTNNVRALNDILKR